MVQTIQVTVELPENYTLVETKWLNKQLKNTLPIYWNMEDLRKETRMSDYLINKKILDRPEFQNELKHIWFKGKGGSSSHSFDAKGMKEFLERNKYKIKGGLK